MSGNSLDFLRQIRSPELEGGVERGVGGEILEHGQDDLTLVIGHRQEPLDVVVAELYGGVLHVSHEVLDCDHALLPLVQILEHSSQV